jgi:hypothetical protein
VFVGIRWIVGLWSDYSLKVFESFLRFIYVWFYSLVFLSDLSFIFGQVDWFIFSGRGAW